MPTNDTSDVDKMRQAVIGALQEMTRGLEGFDKKAKDVAGAHGGVKSLHSVLGELTKTFTGPVGVAAVIYEATKSLNEFADSRLKLKLLSTDVGFTTGMLVGMRKATFEAGKEMADANRIAGSIGTTLQELRAKRHGAAIFQDLEQIGQTDWANQLLVTVDTGDFNKALNLILEKWRVAGPRTRFLIAQAFHVSPSDIDSIVHSQEEVAERSQEAAERYAKQIRAYRQMFSDAWEYAAGGILEGLDNNIQTIRQKMTLLSPSEMLEATIHGKAPARLTNPNAPSASSDSSESKPWYYYLSAAPIAGALSGVKNAYSDAMNSGNANHPWLRKLDQTLGFGAASIGDTGATFKDRFGNWDSGQKTDELINVNKQSNTALNDIRDILRGDSPTGGGGGSGGGGTYGTGARKPGSALQGGLGGFRPGGVGTRADRNNNPGNIEYGEFAKAHGATGSDGRFAIFPDRETGFKAAEDLLGGKGYSGLTLGQIGSRWAEGDASWAQRVSKATGVPIDAVPNAEQRSQIVRKGLMAGEGSRFSPGFEPGSAHGAHGGGAVPSRILEEAKKAALLGPEAVQKYIRDRGYNVDSAWCGDFAAAVVRSAGGTPPKDPQIASNWRNYGHRVEGDPQPGDIAVQRTSRYGGLVRTGQTGGHVTIANSFDASGFWGYGGNQRSGRLAHFSRDKYDFYRDDSMEARNTLDHAQSLNQRIDANMNAVVDFKNMPSWVKSSVDSNGAFKNLKVNRSTPQDGRADGGQVPY